MSLDSIQKCFYSVEQNIYNIALKISPMVHNWRFAIVLFAAYCLRVFLNMY